MLIVNADYWGRSLVEADAALRCLKRERITSVSAMVSRQDSGRAAELAKANELLWDYILIFLKNLRIRGVQKNLESTTSE